MSSFLRDKKQYAGLQSQFRSLYYPLFSSCCLETEKFRVNLYFELSEHSVPTADEQQQSYFASFLNNFNVIHFQIGIILRFNCYQQPDQVLLNNKDREFSAGAVWPLQIARFTMGCC